MLVQNYEFLTLPRTKRLQPVHEIHLLEDVILIREAANLREGISPAQNEGAWAPLKCPHAPVLALPRELKPPRAVDHAKGAATSDMLGTLKYVDHVPDQLG